MNIEEFNDKYKDYIKNGHYGLAFDNEDFINWLDIKFQKFIKNKEFKYSQIKVKFGTGRFYCNGISNKEVIEIEDRLTKLSKI